MLANRFALEPLEDRSVPSVSPLGAEFRVNQTVAINVKPRGGVKKPGLAFVNPRVLGLDDRQQRADTTGISREWHKIPGNAENGISPSASRLQRW